MAEARDQYLLALYDLSKADPSRWATFVEAFKAYTMSELERITTSPPDSALVAIGFGRKMKELRDDFVGIEALAGKLKR